MILLVETIASPPNLETCTVRLESLEKQLAAAEFCCKTFQGLTIMFVLEITIVVASIVLYQWVQEVDARQDRGEEEQHLD